MTEEAAPLKDLTLELFSSRNRVANEDWLAADISWELLKAIGADHETQTDQLSDTAALYARTMQRFHKVHSVRWRVKSPEHLMQKIVRKRAEKNERYADISIDNYFEVVSDLVGLRALHLFKEDCFEIDTPMRKSWKLAETPVAYIRGGDQGPHTERLAAAQFDVKVHKAGYRSVHYVVETRPLSRTVYTEVQVRTIFEEGWSEIDHTVRYPNFSDNQLVGYFLAIFNRMSGSADEMGAFVKELIGAFAASEAELTRALEEKRATLDAMEETMQQLEALKQEDAASKDLIGSLRAETSKLKRSQEKVEKNVHTQFGLDPKTAEMLRELEKPNRLLAEYMKVVKSSRLEP